MPAMLEDPTSTPIYRVSGEEPYPVPYGPLPPDVTIRQVTLRDRITIATLIPFSSPAQVPPKLAAYLCELLNREIEKGDTYPMLEPMALSAFAPYWFSNFAAVMIMGDVQDGSGGDELAHMEHRGVDWSRECLGSFYIKPNYPGRSSHVCSGGFLVTDAARNRGVGRQMGECYLEWAPKLGYTYSVFNLVYETNVASLRIWDALGFKRIGRVKGCGSLKSYPDQLIDAIIFGRELGGEGDEYVSEERFDKIRYYLKTGTYPNGSDRAEKSRLRSAATHYRLVPSADGADKGGDGGEMLMLKGKEVISDPHKQYEIARRTHAISHGGINKTTASIAERYHWVRIKETVSAAIRNCNECKDPAAGKTASSSSSAARAEKRSLRSLIETGNQSLNHANNSANHISPGLVSANDNDSRQPQPQQHMVVVAAAADPVPSQPHPQSHSSIAPFNASAVAAAAAAARVQQQQQQQQQQHSTLPHDMQYDYGVLPVDPQIMVHQQWPHPIQQQQQQQQQQHALAQQQQHSQGQIIACPPDGVGVGVGVGVEVPGVDTDVDARLREELAAEMMQAAAVAAAAAAATEHHHGGYGAAGRR